MVGLMAKFLTADDIEEAAKRMMLNYGQKLYHEESCPRLIDGSACRCGANLLEAKLEDELNEWQRRLNERKKATLQVDRPH
jgi:hypothetical protein